MAASWFRAPWSRSTGAQVNGYRLLPEIGAGGFSTVYAAEDLGAGRRVALKLAHTGSRQAHQKFDAEAAIGARLASTRGIVGTLARTRTRDGRPVLVMPYYDLGNAATLLAEDRRLPLAEVVDLVQEIAQGLDAMHRQHYLHRDISPRNILRSTELGSALGDLGCARAFNSTTEPPWTQALTPGYAAPETTRAVSVQTITSDVYGLAATAWALFTGVPPYGRPPDSAALELVARHELLRNSHPPATGPLLAAGLSVSAAEVLAQALDPDPARRPGRVLDLSDALARALGTGRSGQVGCPPAVNRPVDAATVGPIRPTSTRASGNSDRTELADNPSEPSRPDRPGRSRRRRWPVVVAVLACFVLSFTVVRALSGPPAAPGDEPSPSAIATGSAQALEPGDYGKVAPRDLRVTQIADDGVLLRWTPPTDPDAVVLLYRSMTAGNWQQTGIDLQGAKGQAEVPVTWSGGRYCFMLIVVAGASRGFTSNAVCLGDSAVAG